MRQPFLHLARILHQTNHPGSVWHGSPRIPKGFRLKAQGCREAATLGPRATNSSNRNAVADNVAHGRERGKAATALRLMISFGRVPGVGSRIRQPRAGGLNPFGIAKTLAHLSCKIRERCRALRRFSKDHERSRHRIITLDPSLPQFMRESRVPFGSAHRV